MQVRLSKPVLKLVKEKQKEMNAEVRVKPLSISLVANQVLLDALTPKKP
jgi:hypothetical protein